LQPNDSIFVPAYSNTVYVFGQVVRPGHVPFIPGTDVRYYIDEAGGYLGMAEISGIRVIKANTQQWLQPGGTTIEESDYIWVPKEQDMPFGYYLNIVGQVASVLSIAITTIVIAVGLSK
jgi:protein involved in polysaccharide export with SLBB domain